MPMEKYRNSLSRKLRELGRTKARSIEIKGEQDRSLFQMIHTPDRLTPTRPTPTEEECREEIRKWHEAADKERYKYDASEHDPLEKTLDSVTRRNQQAGASWAAAAPRVDQDTLVDEAEAKEDESPYSRNQIRRSRRGAVGGEERLRASGYDAFPLFRLPRSFHGLDLNPTPERSAQTTPTPTAMLAPSTQPRKRSTSSTSSLDLMGDISPAASPDKTEPPPRPVDKTRLIHLEIYRRGFCPRCRARRSQRDQFRCGQCGNNLAPFATDTNADGLSIEPLRLASPEAKTPPPPPRPPLRRETERLPHTPTEAALRPAAGRRGSSLPPQPSMRERAQVRESGRSLTPDGRNVHTI